MNQTENMTSFALCLDFPMFYLQDDSIYIYFIFNTNAV